MKIFIRRFITMLTALAIGFELNAQQINESFFLRGKVINKGSDSLIGSRSGLFSIDPMFYIPLQSDGSFARSVDVEGPQIVRIGTPDGNFATAFHAEPNDTIDMVLDGKNAKVKSLSTATQAKTKRLQFEHQQSEKFDITRSEDYFHKMDVLADSVYLVSVGKMYNEPVHIKFTDANGKKIDTVVYNRMFKQLFDSTPRSRKLAELRSKIADLASERYQQRLLFLLRHREEAGSYIYGFIDDIYFSQLAEKSLDPKRLRWDDSKNAGLDKKAIALIPPQDYYKKLSPEMLLRSKEYRDFIFEKVRWGDDLTQEEKESFKKISGDRMDFAANDYLQGLIRLKENTTVRDWYLAKSVIFSFQHYDVTNAETLYNDYLKRAGEGIFKEKLKAFYNTYKTFIPGQPGPQFALKNEKGEEVKLSDFKGKVVYIDFWGVHCGPCIGEIKQDVPQLHKKYRDKSVVFVNICTDETVSAWKQKIKELNLTGVNLKAEDGDAVTNAYKIGAIPHHILIDKHGNFVNYNAEAPYNLVGLRENELDKALAK